MTIFVHREEKESWIKAKYENKEFLPPQPYQDVPLGQVIPLEKASTSLL